jgi:DNA primase
MIASKRPLIEFAIERSISKFDVTSREGQIAAVRAAAPIVAQIQDSILRSSYEKFLSEITLVDRSAVNHVVSEAAKGVRREFISGEQTKVEVPVANAELPPVNLNDPINRQERWLLEVVAQLPSSIDAQVLKRIFRIYFSAPRHLAIAKSISDNFGREDLAKVVGEELPPELAALWREILMTALPVFDDEGKKRYAFGVIQTAQIQTIEFEKQFLLQALGQAKAAQKAGESDQIAKKLLELDR